MSREQTLFFEPMHPSLARKISITSPAEFMRSIDRVMADGYSIRDRRALVLAQNRVRAQLNRKNLKPETRMKFMAISRIEIPSLR